MYHALHKFLAPVNISYCHNDMQNKERKPNLRVLWICCSDDLNYTLTFYVYVGFARMIS